MPRGTEPDVIASAAIVAKQGLAGRYSMAIEAIPHKSLGKRVHLIGGRPQPNRRPETFAVNRGHGCKPKDLVRRVCDNRTDVLQAPLRRSHNQYSELRLAEQALEF